MWQQHTDASDGRATALSATRTGRNLCARITEDLVDQQTALLADLDPDVRAGVVNVIRRLAQAADSRFRRVSRSGRPRTVARRARAGQPAAADFFGSVSCHYQSWLSSSGSPNAKDAAAIADIYNQGIAERGSTFETEPRSVDDINARLADQLRFPTLVAEDGGTVLGWAGLSRYRARACYAGIGEFSVYLRPDGARTRRRPPVGRGARRGRARARLLEARVPDLSVQHRQSRPLPRVRLPRSRRVREARVPRRPMAGRRDRRAPDSCKT